MELPTFTKEEQKLLRKHGYKCEGLVAEDKEGWEIHKNPMGKFNYALRTYPTDQFKFYKTLEELFGMDMVQCKDCGYAWRPAETEEYNISFCNGCYSSNIKLPKF